MLKIAANVNTVAKIRRLTYKYRYHVFYRYPGPRKGEYIDRQKPLRYLYPVDDKKHGAHWGATPGDKIVVYVFPDARPGLLMTLSAAFKHVF